MCRDAGFVEQEIRALSSMRKDRRIEAVYRLGGMRAEEAVPQLQQLMNRTKYGPMTIIIARAIAKSAVSSQQIREMLSKLLSYDKAIHHMAADILLETRLDSASLMRKLLDDPDPGLVKVSLVAMWDRPFRQSCRHSTGWSDPRRRTYVPRPSSCILARTRP